MRDVTQRTSPSHSGLSSFAPWHPPCPALQIPAPQISKRTRISGNRSSEQTQDSSLPSRSSSTAKSPFKQATEFWFDDGNSTTIVASPQRVAFRIYRGLLASQSTIFSDVFASSSSSAEETFQGCLVVQLSDSHHDLSHLLRVLLPKSCTQ